MTICGLAGFSLSPDERVNARALSVALLLEIEERGGHATGAAFFDGGQAWVQKGPLRAPQFVDDLDMSAHAPTAVLHTRYGTKGPRTVNENNHPIEIPGQVLGVHNGVVYNDEALFERIGPDKRIAEVDSEAIFSALAHLDGPVGSVLSLVEGSASVAWLEPDGDPHTVHVARLATSPLVYAHTEAGSFVFASTRRAVLTAASRAGLDLVSGPWDLPEGVYVRVRHGQVIEKQTFTTPTRSARPLSAVERKALNLA